MYVLHTTYVRGIISACLPKSVSFGFLRGKCRCARKVQRQLVYVHIWQLWASRKREVDPGVQAALSWRHFVSAVAYVRARLLCGTTTYVHGTFATFPSPPFCWIRRRRLFLPHPSSDASSSSSSWAAEYVRSTEEKGKNQLRACKSYPQTWAAASEKKNLRNLRMIL